MEFNIKIFVIEVKILLKIIKFLYTQHVFNGMSKDNALFRREHNPMELRAKDRVPLKVESICYLSRCFLHLSYQIVINRVN